MGYAQAELAEPPTKKLRVVKRVDKRVVNVEAEHAYLLTSISLQGHSDSAVKYEVVTKRELFSELQLKALSLQLKTYRPWLLTKPGFQGLPTAP